MGGIAEPGREPAEPDNGLRDAARPPAWLSVRGRHQGRELQQRDVRRVLVSSGNGRHSRGPLSRRHGDWNTPRDFRFGAQVHTVNRTTVRRWAEQRARLPAERTWSGDLRARYV